MQAQQFCGLTGVIVVNGAALDLKEHVDRKDLLNRYGRQDIIYVLLDKRIDDIKEEVKELKSNVKDLQNEMRDEFKDVRGEIKDVRGEIGKTNERIDKLFSLMVSMKTWGIGLAVAILLGIAGIIVTIVLS